MCDREQPNKMRGRKKYLDVKSARVVRSYVGYTRSQGKSVARGVSRMRISSVEGKRVEGWIMMQQVMYGTVNINIRE